MNRLVNWIDERFPLVSTLKNHLTDYYVPKNLNFFYIFGSIALFLLLNQVLTGLWLTMFYTPTAEHAFNSIQYIMRDVSFGWLLRYLHTTGASAFFIVIYLHLFRGLIYGSYKRPRELVWLFGMVLFVLLILEAFLGYLLPWGQMSYWGAQVITSLFSAIPFIGDDLVLWIRGDYSVGNATLGRFFAMHVIGLPLLIIILVFLHIVALHKVGSNNPQGVEIKNNLDSRGKPIDGIPFHPFYTIKDLFGLLIFLLGFFAIVFFAPDFGGYFLEQANFEPANPMVTPVHIAPIWYMTPFYTILRAIPNKLLGVVAMGAAILSLFFLPWLDNSRVRSMRYKGLLSRWALVAFVASFIVLGVLGSQPVTFWSQKISRMCVIIYFAYFLLMPFYSRYEKHQIPPQRIK